MEIIITNDNFEAEVLKSEMPVLVDFYADWCGPCKMMAPTVEKIAEAYEGKIKVGKCNIDENSEIAVKYRVMSIPTFAVFKNGEIATITVGAMSQADLEAKINGVL